MSDKQELHPLHMLDADPSKEKEREYLAFISRTISLPEPAYSRLVSYAAREGLTLSTAVLKMICMVCGMDFERLQQGTRRRKQKPIPHTGRSLEYLKPEVHIVPADQKAFLQNFGRYTVAVYQQLISTEKWGDGTDISPTMLKALIQGRDNIAI